MTIRIHCSRCDAILGPQTMVPVRWRDQDGEAVEDHLCRPCHTGLDIVVTNYMCNPDLEPQRAPSTVDIPNRVPPEWTAS